MYYSTIIAQQKGTQFSKIATKVLLFTELAKKNRKKFLFVCKNQFFFVLLHHIL